MKIEDLENIKQYDKKDILTLKMEINMVEDKELVNYLLRICSIASNTNFSLKRQEDITNEEISFDMARNKTKYLKEFFKLAFKDIKTNNSHIQQHIRQIDKIYRENILNGKHRVIKKQTKKEKPLS